MFVYKYYVYYWPGSGNNAKINVIHVDAAISMIWWCLWRFVDLISKTRSLILYIYLSDIDCNERVKGVGTQFSAMNVTSLTYDIDTTTNNIFYFRMI